MAQYPANIELSSLGTTNGFELIGASFRDKSGTSVASAGDVNGDGFADLIVGAPGANRHHYYSYNGETYYSSRGESYVIFGNASGFGANFNLSSVNGSNGFRLNAAAADEHSGSSVASAGDVNGDGFDDVIIGVPGADSPAPPGGRFTAAYVVFGKESGFVASIDPSSLDGSNGFELSGTWTGNSVASAGDVNGDGFADVIIGSRGQPPAGKSYVVFGMASGFAADFDLSSLDGSNGFTLSGVAAGDQSGQSVASAGDVNGDGFADLIVGTRYADAHGEWSGVSYVVFGKASGFAANIDLSSLDGSNGFKLSGAAAGDRSGFSVASAGDVNSDGFADLIVGAFSAVPNGIFSGASYVVFGKASRSAANIDLSSLDGSNGFKLSGVAAGDRSGFSVGSAGDVNGDGFADLIVGAHGAEPHGLYSGASYVVFGKASGFAANIDLSSLDGSNGFKLSGVAAFDVTGWSVASAGDVNGDGLGDLIVGAPLADANGDDSGASWVIYGRAPDAAVDRTGTSASQTLAGGAFNDTLSGLGGNDDLFGHGGNDTLKGGAGNDLLKGGADNDSLFGHVGNDRLKGGTGNDRLESGAGNDELNGGVGADTMVGGDGDDTYIVDNPLDVVVETGTGYDRLSTSVSVALTATQAIDFLDGRGTAGLMLAGNQLANSVWGSAGNDTVAGAGGDDSLRGKGGNDTLFGGKGNDTLEGGDGADLFRYRLGDGNDQFTDFSGAAADRIALVNVTVSQLVNNIATLSDGSVLTAQTGYSWAASDFMPA